MKRLAVPIALLFIAAFAQGAEWQVGSKVGEFSLAGANGAAVTYAPGQPTLVVFTSVQCPVSNAYNERMKALYNDYNGKGIRFLFVNSNQTESAADVLRHAQSAGFPFSVYKDVNNVVADRFGAQFTPETFLIDAGGVLRYHGHIDDAQNPARITSNTLRTALDAVLSGKPVERAETKAFGCTIKRARKAS